MRRQLTAKYEAVEIHYRLFIVPKSEIPYTRRASKTLWARSFELLVPFDSSFQFGFCAIVQRFCLFHRIAKTFYGLQFFCNSSLRLSRPVVPNRKPECAFYPNSKLVSIAHFLRTVDDFRLRRDRKVSRFR